MYMQKPEEKVLGSSSCASGRAGKRRIITKKHTFTYIPIIKTIDSILSDRKNVVEVRLYTMLFDFLYGKT